MAPQSIRSLAELTDRHRSLTLPLCPSPALPPPLLPHAHRPFRISLPFDLTARQLLISGRLTS
jgi:hypothetical protein